MQRFLSRFNFLCFVLLVVVLLGGIMLSQTQLGQITGTIVDPKGAVVPGATVTVANLGTASKEVTQTGNEGTFAVANIPIGDYEIAVEKEGFRRALKRVRVEVAQHVNVSLTLEVGAVSETIEVAGTGVVVNTASAEVGREITGSEISTMPLATRNPYVLLTLAPGSVNTSVSNGDASAQGALGIAVAGARGREINFLLDGSENNETFSTGPSTLVPVEAIEEFKVQSNNMTAEFGRNSLQANVVTKSGTNSLHGSASEFYRGAGLSSQPIEEKVNNIPKGNYVRNVFGASLGGPIVKGKTFFFGAFEGTRVRSVGRNFYYVPTQNFFNASSSNMQAYLTAGGGVPSPLLPDVITAGDIVAFETAQKISAAPALLDSTGTPIPTGTALFQRTFDSIPIDAGGGIAQNTWSISGRVDHKISDNTNLSGRYAWYRQEQPVGSQSDSPFPAFDTAAAFRSQNGTLTLTHTFSAVLFNETRIAYSRTEPQQPLGKGSVNVQCLQYGELTSLGTKDPIVFPGYVPANCQALALPSGGPQNTYSGYTSFTYVKGINAFKWGAYGRHLRDNHTFGASENAASDSIAMQDVLNGVIDDVFSVAIDPKGHVPVATDCISNPTGCYDPAVDGPLRPPSFTRHYHYNETALYFEDQIRVAPRFTLTAGVRWEYFGVLHSPNGERFLDANLYLDAVGSPSALTPGGKNIFEQIRDARFARTNNFFNQNWTNFAPRFGFAWDVTGNQRTVLRAGYGIFYDANFGNALFNVIQNPPNYAVLTEISGVNSGNGLVEPNQFDSLTSMVGTGAFRIKSSARMLNRDMKTAYTQQWNAVVEHDILGKAIFASVGYVGAKGDKLYSLNNLNPQGSCILLGPADCPKTSSRLNQSGLSRMNRRGNESFSRYHSLQTELKTREISHTGVRLAASYTWSHNIDNSTSFFNDSAFDSNGVFGFGNPFDPAASKGDSSNDIRHRFTGNYTWEIPWARNWSGVRGAVLGGWQLAGIVEAQTGATFSVYEDQATFGDLCELGSNGCYPVVVGPLPRQQREKTFVGPNRSVLYDFSSSLTDLGTFCGKDPACIQQDRIFQPKNLFLHRNTFRTPGYWNYDASILKNFKLPREGMSLQLRGEFFNVFNHSNLYANPNTNLLSAGQVTARRGVPPSHDLYGVVDDRRNLQVGAVLKF